MPPLAVEPRAERLIDVAPPGDPYIVRERAVQNRRVIELVRVLRRRRRRRRRVPRLPVHPLLARPVLRSRRRRRTRVRVLVLVRRRLQRLEHVLHSHDVAAPRRAAMAVVDAARPRPQRHELPHRADARVGSSAPGVVHVRPRRVVRDEARAFQRGEQRALDRRRPRLRGVVALRREAVVVPPRVRDVQRDVARGVFRKVDRLLRRLLLAVLPRGRGRGRRRRGRGARRDRNVFRELLNSHSLRERARPDVFRGGPKPPRERLARLRGVLPPREQDLDQLPDLIVRRLG
eukprot:31135-Pelagococcus_subviridis.AAC.33